MQSSQFPYLVWWAAFKSLPANPLPPWIHILCDLSVSGQSTAGWDEMSFSISDSKNTVTSVLVILTHTSLSDTYLWGWVAMWWAAYERPKQCLPLVTGMYSKLAKSWIQGMNLEMESFPGKSCRLLQLRQTSQAEPFKQLLRF